MTCCNKTVLDQTGLDAMFSERTMVLTTAYRCVLDYNLNIRTFFLANEYAKKLGSYNEYVILFWIASKIEDTNPVEWDCLKSYFNSRISLKDATIKEAVILEKLDWKLNQYHFYFRLETSLWKICKAKTDLLAVVAIIKNMDSPKFENSLKLFDECGHIDENTQRLINGITCIKKLKNYDNSTFEELNKLKSSFAIKSPPTLKRKIYFPETTHMLSRKVLLRN